MSNLAFICISVAALVLKGGLVIAATRPECVEITLAELLEPLVRPPKEVTPHGKLERLPVNRDQVQTAQWVKKHPDFAHKLGMYEAEPGYLWVPDVGEYNYRVKRMLHLENGFSQIVQHFPTKASADDYNEILSKIGFPLATEPGFRMHDLEHGAGIVMLSRSPHGRLVLEAAYKKVQAFNEMYHELVQLMPDRKNDLYAVFYTGFGGWGALLADATGFIERGTFGISEIMFSYYGMVSKGETQYERIHHTLDILGNAVDAQAVDLKTSTIIPVKWSARSLGSILFTEGPFAKTITATQRSKILELLDKVDQSIKPVDQVTLDAATRELEQLLTNY